MFKRRWRYFWKLRAEDGSWITYRNKSVTYHDNRGQFDLGFEDNWLFPEIKQTCGSPVVPTGLEKANILDCVLDRL